MILVRGYINILILLIFLIHLIHLILLILLKMNSINSINSINNTTVSSVTLEKYWLTNYLNAGYLSFPFNPGMLHGSQDHRKNAVKLARFMHGLGVKNGSKSADNSLIMVRDNYAKNTYRNHEFNIPNFSHNIRCFQMINDLQRGFENADNFSLV